MAATIFILMLVVASGLDRLGWFQVLPGAGALRRLVYTSVGATLYQLGVLGLILVALDYLWILGVRRGLWRGRSPGPFLVLLLVALLLGFGTGEAALRLLYHDGLSFAHHRGPLVRRFERDFEFNRYDGPSRGPEVSGPKRPGVVRVLVQGDSVTWGQGVQREQDLFTSVLQEKFRRQASPVEIAVLAQPGREIDGHLAQLRRWGAEVEPDIILYQWFVNDLELNHAGRPSCTPPWRCLFFNDLLLRYSYFWFLLDDRLTAIWPAGERSYGEYVLESFEGDTPEWRAFARVFEEWAKEARKLTPHVLVVLYPFDAGNFRDQRIHAQMIDLAESVGVAGLDLFEAEPTFRDESRRLRASRFDPHPGPEAHHLIADAVHRRLDLLWPETLRGAADPEITLHSDGP